MNKLLIPVVFLMLSMACKKENKTQNFTMVDYRQVKIAQDTLNLLLQKDFYGNWLKYSSFHQKNGSKEMAFVGTSHDGDTNHVQYQIMEKIFAETKPQIAFNEGGNWHIKGKYKARNEAILGSGEVGLLQLLCDKSNIEMVNGDMKDTEEYEKLFSEFPFEKVYLLLSVERFLNPYRFGAYGKVAVNEAFEGKFMDRDFKKLNIKFKPEQYNYAYLEQTYKKYFGKPISLEHLEPMWEYYLTKNDEFGQLHRRSKTLRDSVLLSKIDFALNKYDRVFVTFGASHILAVKPALKQIIEKERN